MKRRTPQTSTSRRHSTSAGAHRVTLAAMPRSYLALFQEFPVRPIKTTLDYDRAAAIIHRLAMREGKLDRGEEAFLEVLEALVERYDTQHAAGFGSNVSPTQALRTLVKQAGMTVTELGELLGSKGAASELLSGKRKEPSKSQIAILCQRFRVDASLFLAAGRTSSHAA